MVPRPQVMVVSAWLQEVDTAFLIKADLETNAEALVQEIDFLKGLYEEVPAAPPPTDAQSGAGWVGTVGRERSCQRVLSRAGGPKGEPRKKSAQTAGSQAGRLPGVTGAKPRLLGLHN